MNVQHLDHLNMTVADFDQTVEWYGRVFGFHPVEEDVDEEGVRWGVIRAGAAMLCIYEHPELRHEDRFAMAGQGYHTVSHFGLRMSDRRAWEETVAREQVPLSYGGPVRWPRSTAWYVKDPTGYEIEVVCWDENHIAFADSTADI